MVASPQYRALLEMRNSLFPLLNNVGLVRESPAQTHYLIEDKLKWSTNITSQSGATGGGDGGP